MAENFYTILTNTGKAKIANATALGDKVNFTTLKAGDSNGNYYNPTETQEDLIHTVWQGNINSITTDEKNPNWITIAVVIPSDIGGFTIREVGIFDDAGDMLAIGKYPETYKPQVADGSTKDITIRMILEVSNSASVTLKVDPTVTLATKTDFYNLAGAGRTTETVKGNSDDIKALKQDYEYQAPTISNTQVQLVKHSDTNILKFKLDSNLSGNITISTDAGATEKPLVDTDGTQVASLEKGFVEVVADADFFTLRNRGGLSTTDKQNLIDIANEAESNNSTVKTDIINSVNTTLSKTLNTDSVWNQIKAAIDEGDSNALPSNIKKGIIINKVLGTLDIESLGGKKWASGTTKAGEQTSFVYADSSGAYSAYPLTIPIAFEPSLVLAVYHLSISNYLCVYSNIYDGIYAKTSKIISYTGRNDKLDVVNCKGDISPAGITSNGFVIPAIGTGWQYDWIAIE